jgi:hypothetical protein
MKAESHRQQLTRLLRQTPFQPFVIVMDSTERAIVEHPENLAIDSNPGGRIDFHVLSGRGWMYGTFESIACNITMDAQGPTAPPPAAGANP